MTYNVFGGTLNLVWVRHSEGPPFRRSGTIVQSAFTGIKTDSANKRYLFNAIPDTNHNANPTNPNRYSKGNPSEWRTYGMADLRNGGPLPLNLTQSINRQDLTGIGSTWDKT